MSKARKIAFSALLAAVLFVAQVALSFLPNIEVVSILVIVSAVVFGRLTLVSIYAFALLEGLCYGFGIWVAGIIVMSGRFFTGLPGRCGAVRAAH